MITAKNATTKRPNVHFYFLPTAVIISALFCASIDAPSEMSALIAASKSRGSTPTAFAGSAMCT